MTKADTLQNIKTSISQKKYGYFLIYTLVFAVACVLAYSVFIINDVSFIWVGGAQDGYAQHYTALMYIGQWGREVLRNIFVNHSFEIPMWDFSIGYGSDVITSMHYYAFGDPLNLLSILVPSKYTEHLYCFLIILRMYLAGLTFSMFCLKMNRSKWGTLAGAITYVLSGYMVFAGIRHPFFINPMIYLPLILLGAEKILRKESFCLFVVAVCVGALCNFYFLYMMVIAVVIYVAVRYFTMERQRSVKDAFAQIGKFLLLGILGVAMAGVIFIPVVNVLFNSNRMEVSGGITDWFYQLNYYKKLVVSMFAGDTPAEWTCLSFSAPSFVAIVTLFMTKKKHRGSKVCLIALFVMLLFPIFGKVMNGFSYVSNRWTFIFAALVSFIFATIWQDILSLSKKKILALLLSAIVYFCLCLALINKANMATFVSMGIILLCVILLLMYESKSFKRLTANTVSLLLVLLTVASGVINSNYKLDSTLLNYVGQFKESGLALEGIQTSSDKAVARVTKDEFARNEQSTVSNENSSAITGDYGLQFFWSLENPVVSDFLMENSYCNFMNQKYNGLDSRTYLDALASVKYYVESSNSIVPYGFEEKTKVKYKVSNSDKKRKYKIYENQYALPMGYTYDSYIDKADYLNMSAVERQQAMLQGVVLEDTNTLPDLDNYSKTQVEYNHQVVDSTITSNKKVYMQDDGSFLVNKGGSSITIEFEGMENCETYLHISGVDYEVKSKYDLYMDDYEDKFSKEDFEKLSKLKQNEILRADFNTKHSNLNTRLRFNVSATAGKGETARTKFYHMTEHFSYYTGQQDYLINLGYSEKGKNKVTLTFPVVGVYDFDTIEIICQPMEDYEEQVTALAQDVMVNEEIGTNTVTGEINLSEDKILCLSIPYSDGWTASVDGEQAEILKANTMYMALPLTKGSHKIELKYSTPLLKESVIISMVAFGVFIVLMIVYTIIKRRKKNKA